MTTPRTYWFPAKRYGWGWGPPIAWQGWLVLVLWSLALLAGVLLLRYNRHPMGATLAFVLLMGAVLTLLCYWKGEPPRWRWGDPSQ